MNELWHLRRFTDEDEAVAAESFNLLSERLRPYLNRLLANRISGETDREDVIQAVLTKIWVKRTKFQPTTVGGWFLYASRIAQRAAIDFHRSEIPTLPLDGIAESESEESFLDTLAMLGSSRRLLYQIADESWLGVRPALSPEQRNRRLVAGQLFYLHGSTASEVADLMDVQGRGGASEIDFWLTEPSTIASGAFHHLYVGNEDLVRHVLGEPCAECAAKVALGQGIGPWSHLEARIALNRLRNGLPTERLLRMIPDASETDIQTTVRKCKDKFPFTDHARELKYTFRRHPNVFTEINLWKRLVFQYHAADELPHKQILERVGPAAEVFGVSITEAMLTAWLSVGRLLAQLESHNRKTHSS